MAEASIGTGLEPSQRSSRLWFIDDGVFHTFSNRVEQMVVMGAASMPPYRPGSRPPAFDVQSVDDPQESVSALDLVEAPFAVSIKFGERGAHGQYRSTREEGGLARAPRWRVFPRDGARERR